MNPDKPKNAGNNDVPVEPETLLYGQKYSVAGAGSPTDIATSDEYAQSNPGADTGAGSTGVDLSHPADTVRIALDQAQQRAGDAVDQLRSQAGDVVDQLRTQAGDTVDKIKVRANDQLDSQLTQAGVSLASVASAVDTISEQLRQGNQEMLATYADRAAGQVDQMASYLRQSDPNKVLRDIEDFARREPALFLAGAFAVGLLSTRFLKSSSSQTENRGNG